MTSGLGNASLSWQRRRLMEQNDRKRDTTNIER
jgi:hypothetical protein